MQGDSRVRPRPQRWLPVAVLASACAWTLLIASPLAWAGDSVDAVFTMPQSVSDTPFSSERDAVVWRREELKEIESLVRQLRFDLVNNQDAEAAAPRLAELQERASAEHLLPAFIEGTHGSGSEARPSIWAEWDNFTAGFNDLESHVNALVEAAHGEDYRGAARALSDVATTCRSCHRVYRYR
ncbi:MAG: cytochrome c [Halomonas sp.]|nr:cytochrome c [Halomonas sp.]TVP48011.1 MAG: cytochrome c [Halomonas sp.]